MSFSFDAALRARIEDASLNASAVVQQRMLDGWLVRFAPGKPKRARCVNAIAAGRLAIQTKLDEVSSIYAEAGLPTIFRITPFSNPAELDETLASRGWARFDETLVMALAAWRSDATDDLVAHLDEVDADAFSRIAGMLRGLSPGDQRALARRLNESPVRYATFAMRIGSEVVGGGAIAIDGDLVGLYEIVVAESARRRGHAARLCRALLQHAAAHEARSAYLQVDLANAAAVALYGSLGFTEAYRYHYRAVDPSTA